ncbi:MAG TPA: phytanoyl-CoA dioxygenase family protein [Steroidobacteraceae bacterium]|nr:phytanoyl-CoA dioxygenase family protein [Steroidobacteraceae bacterium]
MSGTEVVPSASRPQQETMAATEQIFGDRAASTVTFPPAFNTSDVTGPRLTAEQLADFRRDGFLCVENLTTRDEIESLIEAYDRLFTEKRGWEAGDLFDMVGRDDLNKGLSLPQMLWPSRYEPLLRQTRLYESAHSLAQQLLGPKLENILEHAISKPASKGAATPWHQDDAFSRPGTGFVEAISIWMPLQDVDVGSGCMQYIKGSNHGPLFDHRSPNNDPRIHGLEVVTPPDLTHCVPVPLPAGGAVIHHSRTLHSAGVNTSNQPRRAYILGYSVQSRPHQRATRDYPWNLEKQTAREERELQAMSPLRRSWRRLQKMIRGYGF